MSTKHSKNKKYPPMILNSPDHALTVYPMSVEYLLHSPDCPKKWNNRDLERVKQNIKAERMIYPILVAPEGNWSNVYHVLTGWLRIRAAAELGYDEIPCIFLDTDGDAALRARITNLLDQESEEWDRETAVTFLELFLNHLLIVSDKKWLGYLTRVEAAQKEFNKAAKAAKHKK